MSRNIIDEVVHDLRTIQDMIRWTVSRFNSSDLFYGHGTDNPWDEAVSLVLHVLHLPPNASKDINTARITESERREIAEIVLKRIETRLPLPYITNMATFAGLNFFVDERVLIPRSPIAECIDAGFQPWLGNKQVLRALDMCTGSACIAIAMAYAFPEAEVDAVDISVDALAVAEMNIQNHGVEQQVIPLKSDGFADLGNEKYDLIVANPPYVDAEDMADLPDEFVHEPELALASGFDGLDLPRQLLIDATNHLTEDGILVMEVGNSMVHLQEQYPQVPFTWLEFENGGHGVFVLTQQDLINHKHTFMG